MHIPHLHPWNLDYASAKKLQIELRSKLVFEDPPGEIHTIAGCDVSQILHSRHFFAAVVIMSYPDMELVEKKTAAGEIDFPYIPGLLSFREMPALLKAWSVIENIPDVILVDGQGTVHPRRMGLACHLGLWLNLPTIGCAKNLLCGEHMPVGENKGGYEEIRLEGEIIGAALRSRQGVKPVFVSPGNRITLQKSLEIVLSTCRYRLPEPLRAAHNLANQARREETYQNPVPTVDMH